MRSFRTLALAAVLLGALAFSAQAQGKPRGLKATIHRINAAADSAGYGWEAFASTRVSQTGDSLPGEYGIGKLIGSRFSVQAAVSAHSVGPSGSSHLEGDFSLGLTAAIFPGSTNLHGEAVYGTLINHRNGSDWQWGVQFGTLLRVVGPDGISARTGPYYRYLISRGPLPSQSGVGATAGISFPL